MKILRTFLNLPVIGPIVNHELGGFVVAIVGAVVGAIMSFISVELAKLFGIELLPSTQAQWTAALTAGGIAVGGGLVQWVQTGSTKELQRLVAQALAHVGAEPIKVDGWIGKETLVGGVKVLKAVAATPQEVAAAEAPPAAAAPFHPTRM